MMIYLLFLSTAILIFVAFRVIRLVSHRLKGLSRFYPILVALELTLWMVFLFWLIHYFFQDKTYYNQLVLMLAVTSVVLLVWYYIKDVVAGFLFRIKHNPRIGQLIFSVEAEGIIKAMKSSQLFVEVDGGDLLRIPYTKLLGSSLSLKTEDANSASESSIIIEDVKDGDQLELERRIRLNLLQSPWCVPNKPIKIEFLTEPTSRIEITLHLVDKSFAEQAKIKVRSLFNQ